MRTRIDYQITSANTIVLTGKYTIEDIRLIVDETQKVVVASSMQKDNIESAEYDKVNDQTTLTIKSSVVTLVESDALTVEADNGDGDIVEALNGIKDAIAAEKAAFSKITLTAQSWDGSVMAGVSVTFHDLDEDAEVSTMTDSNGQCTYQIANGHTFKVVMGSVEGYHDVADSEYLATKAEQEIVKVYYPATLGEEKVIVKFQALDGSLNPSSTLIADFVGDAVSITLADGSTMEGVLDESGECDFLVPYGTTYTFEAPTKDGYKRIYQTSWEHEAGVPTRYVEPHYFQQPETGVYGVDENGAYHDYDAIEAMSSEARTTIKWIAFVSSELGENGFLIPITWVTAGKQWATQNVSFDTSVLPYLTNTNQTTNASYYTGKTNTQAMYDLAKSMGITSPAAEWAMSESITIAGVEHAGFVPSWGQIKTIAQDCWAMVSAIYALLGKTPTNIKSGYWWTSCQYSAPNAVDLYNGGFGSFNKTYSYTVLRVFDL